MRRGDTDKGAWLGLSQTALDIFDPQTRIKQHWYRPHLEQGEETGEEVEGGFEHDQGLDPPADAGGEEAPGGGVRIAFQFGEGVGDAVERSLAARPPADDHRRFVGGAERILAQAVGDVHMGHGGCGPFMYTAHGTKS